MKRLVFVSSAQPAANPRLVKELRWISRFNFTITVIYAPISPWADEFDIQIKRELKHIEWVSAVPTEKQYSIIHYWARLRRRWWLWVGRITNGNVFTAAKGLTLFSQELAHQASRYPADVYVGHNLGALPAVVKAAKRFHAKACFDLEDFHSGEMSHGSIEQKMVQQLEATYLPLTSGLTVSSPLIHACYHNQFPELSFLTIPNVFPYRALRVNRLVERNDPPRLSMIWFSQFVGNDRGIECIIQAMGKCRNPAVRLTLVGNCTSSKKKQLLTLAQQSQVHSDSIVFVNAMSEEDLAVLCSQHDIGLAPELNKQRDKEVAWTNKLFFYPASGIPVLASATEGQLLFMNNFTDAGSVFPIGDAEALAAHIQLYMDDSSLLVRQRKAIQKHFMDIYELEGKKWCEYITSVLDR